MLKKYSREKRQHLPHSRTTKTTSFHSPVKHTTLLLTSLKQKYYHPQITTSHQRLANNLLYNSQSKEAIAFNQAQKLSKQGEILQSYIDFHETARVIKSVVLRRIQKDFYGWISFQDQHYEITRKYYMKRKQLINNNQKLKKYLSQNLMQKDPVLQYIENKLKKQLDNQRVVNVVQSKKMAQTQKTATSIDPNRNSQGDCSTILLKRLTRNLSKMIGKTIPIAAITDFKDKRQQPKTTNNISILMKINNCNDLSVIPTDPQDEIPPYQPVNDYQQGYGLAKVKPKHKKSKKFINLDLRSMDKLNGFSRNQTPNIHMMKLSTQSQYDQIQFNKPDQWKKTKLWSKDKQVPASPNGISSTSFGSNKSLSRNGSTSSNKSRSQRKGWRG